MIAKVIEIFETNDKLYEIHRIKNIWFGILVEEYLKFTMNVCECSLKTVLRRAKRNKRRGIYDCKGHAN